MFNMYYHGYTVTLKWNILLTILLTILHKCLGSVTACALHALRRSTQTNQINKIVLFIFVNLSNQRYFKLLSDSYKVIQPNQCY